MSWKIVSYSSSVSVVDLINRIFKASSIGKFAADTIRVRMRELKARAATRKSSNARELRRGGGKGGASSFAYEFQMISTWDFKGKLPASAKLRRIRRDFTFFIAAKKLGRDWDYQQELRKRKVRLDTWD